MTDEENVALLSQRIDTLEGNLKVLEKKMDKFEELFISVKEIQINQKSIEKTCSEIGEKLKYLTEKPAQRWDQLINKIIDLVIGGFVGYLLIKLGMGG